MSDHYGLPKHSFKLQWIGILHKVQYINSHSLYERIYMHMVIITVSSDIAQITKLVFRVGISGNFSTIH